MQNSYEPPRPGKDTAPTLRLVPADPPQPEDELDATVAEIRRDPIAALFVQAETSGFAAQARQLVLLTIAGVSARVGTPVNVLCVGEPGDGKSTVIAAMTQIVGPDFTSTSGAIQSMTAAALSRMAEGATRHCIILDERARGNTELEGLLRMAASGQRATRLVTVRGEAVELTLEPPVAIIEACLSDREMSLQDRSRYLRIRMGADRERITAAALERFTLAGARRQDSMELFAEAFQVYLASLKPDLRVVVPFAPRLALLAPSPLRDRLLVNFLNAVCTVAWLRQTAREQRHDGALGAFIEASVDDYCVLHEIALAIADDGSDGELSDNALHLLRLWREWTAANGNVGVLRQQLPAVTNGDLSIDQSYRAAKKLQAVGYATGPAGRGSTGHWQLTELGLRTEHPNLLAMLPTPEDLRAPLLNCNHSGRNDLRPE